MMQFIYNLTTIRSCLNLRVHFKLSLAGGDTSQGSQPWAVSSPPTVLKRQFEIHTNFNAVNKYGGK
ncbi:MAG: hypothetical protein ABIP10_04515 [Ferruginibacter sp.]